VEEDDVLAGVLVRRGDRLAERAVGRVADAVVGVGGLVGDVDGRLEGGGYGQREQQRWSQTSDRQNHDRCSFK
jgi:hypothetical protein